MFSQWNWGGRGALAAAAGLTAAAFVFAGAETALAQTQGPAVIADAARAGQVAVQPHATSDQNAFIAASVAPAQRSQSDYGVPASVTISQAILESNWGASAPSNNYFGIKCVSGNPGPIANGCVTLPTTECSGGVCTPTTASFRTYATMTDSFRDHGQMLKSNALYNSAFNYRDNPDQFAREIAADGYATDPNYANLVISIMQSNNLYQYNTGILPPTGQTFDRAFTSTGSWTGAGAIDTRQATQVASAATANGEMHVDTLVKGNVYDYVRHVDGTWSTPVTVDGAGHVSAIALTATPNGDVHLLSVANGDVYHYTLFHDRAAWTGSVIVDSAGHTSTVTAAATAAGDVHLISVANGNVYHSTLFHDQSAFTGFVTVDNAGHTSQVSAAITKDGDLHLATLVNGDIYHSTLFLHDPSVTAFTGFETVDGAGHTNGIALAATSNGDLHLVSNFNGTLWHDTFFLAPGSPHSGWSGAVEFDSSGHAVALSAAGLTNGDLHLDTLG